jgi:hypothetical protein
MEHRYAYCKLKLFDGTMLSLCHWISTSEDISISEYTMFLIFPGHFAGQVTTSIRGGSMENLEKE